MSDPVSSQIKRVLPEVIAIRHDLHAHPELSQKEHRTSARIREALAKLPGMNVLPPLIETDVVAILNADRPGPCLALRADIDGLPIHEQSDVPYKSTTPGVMHACGHDGHTAILLGAAMVLAQRADALPGKVMFIFQPAEEEGGGGGLLCERGILESPKVDGAVALHCWPTHRLGIISVNAGPVMAANNSFEITVNGQGGHGALPHRTVDPIVVAAHVVIALQSIVSRTVDPLETAVVTVGQIEGGSAVNIIPDTCRLRGTLRYAQPEVGEHLMGQVHAIAEQTAQAHGAKAEVKIEICYPPTINDANMTQVIQDAARELFGPEKLVTNDRFTMGAEDFAFYGQRVPAALFRLGLCPKDQPTYPGIHHPTFDFNDDALPVGIAMFCEIATRFLAEQG